MTNRDILAIGTSAGGVEALLHLARTFRSDFPASVLITIHLSSQFGSSLDEVLSHAGPLPASFARTGDRLDKARIYIAPPDHHLLIEDNRLALGIGPRENNARPAIDPMLRSAALCCGSRVVGVVLTGTMGDGASGLWTVSQSGGVTVVQDPSDAAFPEMPQNALNQTKPDHIAHLRQMPALLESLVHEPAGEPIAVPDGVRYEVEMAKSGRTGMSELDRFGRRSVLTCPDCQGVMWEIDEGGLMRFHCHVGHTYTSDLMSLALLDESLRRALASAKRALDERLALAHKLHKQALDLGNRPLAENWKSRVLEFEQEGKVIRDTIQRTLAAREELKRAG